MTEELFVNDAYLRECKARAVAVDATGIRLDRSVFYATGGGQPGDTGRLVLGNGLEIPIIETRRDSSSGELIHVPAPDAPQLQVGEPVMAHIDWERRYGHMKIHSCLHLLCALIKAEVTGCAVHADKGRLDFDLPEATLDKSRLNVDLNALIREGHGVSSRWISDEQLQAQPELVRTMSVLPPMGRGRVRLVEVAGVDLQPCGGTHVTNTAEIGAVVVRKIEKKSRHNRRVTIALEA